jgi:aminoglycoside phosphotransferase (APT) family kinase protein
MQSNTIDIRLIEALVAQIFSRSVPSHVERVEEGVSTYVYKIYRGNEIFYLRVLPEANASFAPEAYVHAMLRARNVKVPEVVYFEHYNEALQRSVMVTTAIKGKHIGHYPVNEVPRSTLVEAGRDLAVINSISVQGFGWIKRDSSKVTALEAELPTYRAFVFEYLEEDLAFLSEHVLSTREIKAIWEIIDRFGDWLDIEQALLAHGDFDATHIYQEHGHYTGIIDFGEIRGGDSFYDLGHFQMHDTAGELLYGRLPHSPGRDKSSPTARGIASLASPEGFASGIMHDGETLSTRMLPYLLKGYREVVHLPPDYEQRIYFSSLLIAIRTLARSIKKRAIDFRSHSGFASIKHDIEVLHGSQ